MFSRTETDRFATIVKLFELLRRGEVEGFYALLSADEVNTPYISVIYDYYNYGIYGESSSLRRVQRSEQYLIHQAIELGDPDVFKRVLQLGGNLLLRERIDEEKWQRQNFKSTVFTKVYPTALEVLSNSTNVFLKQAAFDHISSNKTLYQQPDHYQFISDKLQFAVLTNFNAKCLQFDHGRPLPAGFHSPVELKKFLVESGVNVAGIFFTQEEYLHHLTTPGQIIAKSFLQHALKICQFSAEALQQIYAAVTDKDLRSLLLDHHPEADTDYLAELLKLDGVARLPIPSSEPEADASPPVPQRNPNFTRQVESHLKSRVTLLTNKIKLLKGKKRTAAEERELNNAKASLNYCQEELRTNVVPDDSDDEEYSKRMRQISNH